MLVLHHLEQSRSQRILWLLEELGATYKIKRYDRDPKTQLAPDALRKIHPLGSSPVLVDGNRTLAESGVIAEYLARTQDGAAWVRSPDDEDYWDYLYWMQYAEASLMPPLLVRLIFENVRQAPMPFFLKPVARGIADSVDKRFTLPQIKKHLGFVEGHLRDREWFLGDSISTADIMMSFPLEAAVKRGALGSSGSPVEAYVRRFQARPAYQKALEVGGDYDFLLD